MKTIFSSLLQGYKSAYTGHSREIWALAAFTFINRVGTMVVPFLTVYLTTVLHYPLQQAGILAGMFGVGSMVGSFTGGKLTDHFGGRFVVVCSLASSGAMLIVLQFLTSFEGLAAGIFFTAMCGDAYRPAIMTLTGSFSGGNPGRSMALIRLAANLGFSAAPALGGLVITLLDYSYLFWIDGLSCIIAAVFLLIISRTWANAHHAAAVREERRAGRTLVLPPWRNPRYLLFMLGTFLTAFGFMQWFHSVPVFLKMGWGLDEGDIGLIMGMNGLLIVLIEMPLVNALERTGRARAAMLLGLVMTATSFLPFLLLGSMGMAVVAMLLMTAGEILFQPFNSALVLKLSPEARRGEYAAWYSMSWGVALITAPTIGLGFVGAFGFPLFWGLLILVMGLSIVANAQFDPNKERQGA